MNHQGMTALLPFDMLKTKAADEVAHWSDAAARYEEVARQAAAEGRTDAGDMAEAAETARSQLRHAQAWLDTLVAVEPDSLPAPGVLGVQ